MKASVNQFSQSSAWKHTTAIVVWSQYLENSAQRKMHPYKIIITQDLSKRGWRMSTLCLDLLRSAFLTDVMLFTDEAHFHLSDTVNKQKRWYGSQQNPQELHQWPLHNHKVTVWCAIFAFGLWDPYSFEKDVVIASVKSNRYCMMF